MNSFLGQGIVVWCWVDVDRVTLHGKGQIVGLMWHMRNDPEGGPVGLVGPLQARVGEHRDACMGRRDQGPWIPYVDWGGSHWRSSCR